MKKPIFFSIVLMAIMAQAIQAQSLKLKWSTDSVFRVPESVLFDSKANLLYVSNIDGKSNEKDGKGFISKLSPDGKIIAMEWATGLNAPKGMGRFRDNLFVADLTRVVVIDVNTGKVTKTYEIEGAEFLNDITVDEKGNVYISDSATGKIHRLSGNKVGMYFQSPDFKRVNGLLALKNSLYIADAGNGINYKLSIEKELTKFTETAPGADGVVQVEENLFIVSSWGGEVYYVDASAKAQKLLDTKEQKLNSADVDYDSKSRTLFVPTFFGNKVMAYTFEK